jgi:phosphatidylserine decarboxylase
MEQVNPGSAVDRDSVIVREAFTFLIPLAILTTAAIALGWAVNGAFYYLAAITGAALAFVAFFFRNPHRNPPTGSGLVVAPADGRVVVVRRLSSSDEAHGTLVSIFLSVFDVHINRAPVAGVITAAEYKRGTFHSATGERASVENEQNIVTINAGQTTVVFKQIAGLIARRIVFWKNVGDTVQTGERVGLIRFGSRTDLILPPDAEVLISKGDKVKGGVSVIGRLKHGDGQ